MPARILSCDRLIADIIVPLAADKRLVMLADRYGLVAGSKVTIDEKGFAEFSGAIAGCPVTVAPGGSSANTLTTLSKLLKGDVAVQFLGIAGGGEYGGMIRDSLHEAGIRLLPAIQPEAAQAAISFVLVYPDGQRAIATYPGNGRHILTPDMITDEMVKESAIVLVQGSLWHKFDMRVAGRFLELQRRHGRELWLTLPTQGEFTAEEAAQFHDAMPGAALVFGNDEELLRLWPGASEQALEQLQRVLRQGAGKLGFITCSGEGAAIVTPEIINHVPPVAIAPRDIVNTLGAGDTAFAGFAAGYLKELAYEKAAAIGMALAAEKLRINAPRLSDPLASLAQVAAPLAALLQHARNP